MPAVTCHRLLMRRLPEQNSRDASPLETSRPRLHVVSVFSQLDTCFSKKCERNNCLRELLQLCGCTAIVYCCSRTEVGCESLYRIMFVFSSRLCCCSCPCSYDSLLCAPIDCNGHHVSLLSFPAVYLHHQYCTAPVFPLPAAAPWTHIYTGTLE